MATNKRRAEDHPQERNHRERDCRPVLRAGLRFSYEDPDKVPSFNIYQLTHDPDWEGTDLSDNTTSMSELFKQGVELEDGDAWVDFYVYSVELWGGDRVENLESNIDIVVQDGELLRVNGTGKDVIWHKGLGFEATKLTGETQ